MPAPDRRDPIPSFRFRVEIDGVSVGGFSRVDGLETVLEKRQGGSGFGSPSRGGGAALDHLLLRRGFDTRRDLWEWFEKVSRGEDDRRDLSIEVLDAELEPVVRILVHSARPCGWSLSPLDALEPALLHEEIELEADRFTID